LEQLGSDQVRTLTIVASALLTAIMFASGYAVQFLVTVIAMAFDLPGPLIDSPYSWVWFGFSVLFLFAVSFLFCRWFARRIEKRTIFTRTFE
jgi:bacteriorhodopsin